MMYYRFSTFTTSYYFPAITEETQFLYGLYSPYGGKLSRYYWRKFRQSSFVRSFTSVKEQRLPFPYSMIRTLVEADAILSFNMGTPGEAQKISILGYMPQTQKRFFAKFAQKPEAMRLSYHEIEALQLLKETNLVPVLYDSKVEDAFVYLQTEYVQGHRPYDTLLNDKVVDLLIKLSAFHYPNADRGSNGLLTCLSHGDFCPWNMLVQPDNSLRMIDWEMADERLVGYDIFTWLLNVAGLVTGDIPLYHIIEKNRKHIMRYFNTLKLSDYTPSLHRYVELQIEILQANKQKRMLKMYEDLYAQL